MKKDYTIFIFRKIGKNTEYSTREDALTVADAEILIEKLATEHASKYKNAKIERLSTGYYVRRSGHKDSFIYAVFANNERGN